MQDWLKFNNALCLFVFIFFQSQAEEQEKHHLQTRMGELVELNTKLTASHKSEVTALLTTFIWVGDRSNSWLQGWLTSKAMSQYLLNVFDHWAWENKIDYKTHSLADLLFEKNSMKFTVGFVPQRIICADWSEWHLQ